MEGIKIKVHPDGRPWTINELAEEDGCCPQCWPKARPEQGAGMPFLGIIHPSGERKLKAGEVRVNKAAWGFEEIRKCVMHIPYADKNEDEWAVIDIDISYCPFCGRKLDEDRREP